MRARDVRRILREAPSLRGERMVLLLAPGSGEVAAVAARRVGGAVERNRARRILREAWRQAAPRIGDGHDVVLVARSAIRGAKTQDLVTEMTELLVRAGRMRA